MNMKNEVKTELFDRKFKLTYFGYGEWIDEPDLYEFEYKGIKCSVLRVCKREPFFTQETYFGGHLVGYIFLPENHQWYGKNYDDIPIECHGGISYAEKTEEGYQVGFDCGHLNDIIPSMIEIRKRFNLIPEGLEKHPVFNLTYKNMAFCIRECKSMAKQASKIKAKICPENGV